MFGQLDCFPYQALLCPRTFRLTWSFNFRGAGILFILISDLFLFELKSAMEAVVCLFIFLFTIIGLLTTPFLFIEKSLMKVSRETRGFHLK